jgi:hypothetical protein
MKRKSKFTAFILSAIPGLAHFYIGLAERALIFFMIFAGLLLGSIGLSVITGNGDFMAIFVAGYPLIWLVALIDSFTCINKINMSHLYNNGEVAFDTDQKLNKKTITLSLSIIPGAGHMYLGYQKKGLLIMAAFFFSIFFMGWLGISLLLFILPLIWFYSFFDALHIVDGRKEEVIDQKFELPKVKHEWIGYGLIGVGIVIIIERIVYPLIDYRIRTYIQTSIVSLIFIIAGIYILNKNKKVKVEVSEEEEEDENI